MPLSWLYSWKISWCVQKFSLLQLRPVKSFWWCKLFELSCLLTLIFSILLDHVTCFLVYRWYTQTAPWWHQLQLAAERRWYLSLPSYDCWCRLKSKWLPPKLSTVKKKSGRVLCFPFRVGPLDSGHVGTNNIGGEILLKCNFYVMGNPLFIGRRSINCPLISSEG